MTLLGLIANQNGFNELLNGAMILGVWYFCLGGIGLYGGIYLLGYRETIPRIHKTHRRASG